MGTNFCDLAKLIFAILNRASTVEKVSVDASQRSSDHLMNGVNFGRNCFCGELFFADREKCIVTKIAKIRTFFLH